MTVDTVYALDDIDLAHLTSPPRHGHRRHRSDPSAILPSLRKVRDNICALAEVPEEEAAPTADGGASVEVVGLAELSSTSTKRELSPARNVSGCFPAVKKRLSGPPSELSVSSTAEGAGQSEEEEEDGATSARSHPSVLFGGIELAGQAPLVSEPDPFAKKEPNYSKKDVPMWTVEEDLLILQLVEQVRRRARPLLGSLAHPHPSAFPPPSLALPAAPPAFSRTHEGRQAPPSAPKRRQPRRQAPPSAARVQTALQCPFCYFLGSRCGALNARSMASGGRASHRTCRAAQTTACGTGGTVWSVPK